MGELDDGEAGVAVAGVTAAAEGLGAGALGEADGRAAAEGERGGVGPDGGEGRRQRHGADSCTVGKVGELGEVGIVEESPPSDHERLVVVVDDAAVEVAAGVATGGDRARRRLGGGVVGAALGGRGGGVVVVVGGGLWRRVLHAGDGGRAELRVGWREWCEYSTKVADEVRALAGGEGFWWVKRCA